MIILAISGFVLALCACGAAVALSIISVRLRRAQVRLESENVKRFTHVSANLNKLAEIVREPKLSASAALQAEVAELSAAVGRLGKTQQRLAGAFYAGRAGRELADPPGHGHNENSGELDELLALQRAPSVSPGG